MSTATLGLQARAALTDPQQVGPCAHSRGG
jgi:hypothetical protein